MLKLLAAGLLLLSAAAHAAISERVLLTHGLIEGAPGSSESMMVYKGIPYAAPPVGQNRWREPQPVAAWSGVRSAKEFGPRCIQGGYAPGADQPVTSEDCLYLNVWTPAENADALLPVMLWIHGGGFFTGAGSNAIYDGESLASKGAVVITINYRLGTFGFFAHPELTAESPAGSSGNYAMLDMVKALEWVYENAAAFGGDPNLVTVFGESAGAAAVGALLSSPLARGLIHRSVAQSGGFAGLSLNALPTLAEREQEGAMQTRDFGAGSIAELRQASAADILAAFPTGGAITVDGHFLPRDPALIWADGEQQPVDFLGGSNRDEAVFFGPGIQEAQAFRDYAENRFGELAEAYLALYPAGSDEEVAASYQRAFNDELAWQMRRMGQAQSERGLGSYIYFFTRVPPGQEARGATHVAELAYVFNQHEQQQNWTDTDERLGDLMSAYWVNFARSTNPNGRELPQWPRFTENAPGNVLVLGDEVRPDAESMVPARDALDFFDRAFERHVERLRAGE